MNKLLSADDVAEWLGVSEGWVRDHATRRQPLLPCVKFGNTKQSALRFDSRDIEEFIAKWSKKQ
jgi:hypothetical protein